MTNIKIKGTHPFAQVPKIIFYNKNISFKAIGIFSFLHSLPDDFNLTIKGMCSMFKDSETSITSGLKELEEHGFIDKIKINPCKETNGRISYEYVVYRDLEHTDYITRGQRIQGGGFQGTEKQCTEKQGTEIQCTENHELNNNNKTILTKEELIESKLIEKKGTKVPTTKDTLLSLAKKSKTSKKEENKKEILKLINTLDFGDKVLNTLEEHFLNRVEGYTRINLVQWRTIINTFSERCKNDKEAMSFLEEAMEKNSDTIIPTSYKNTKGTKQEAMKQIYGNNKSRKFKDDIISTSEEIRDEKSIVTRRKSKKE